MHVDLHQLLDVRSGLSLPMAGSKQSPKNSSDKGGDPAWPIFRFLFSKNMYFKEKMTSPPNSNVICSPMVNQLMRAADWVREKGQVRPLSEDPALEESLGILFNVIRRSKKISLERLADRSGFEVGELIAFETGLLSRHRMCEILPKIAEAVGIEAEDFLQQIQTDKN